MSKKVYFDLDGTLYNLYGIENWLDYLENEKSGIFLVGKFIGDYEGFINEIQRLLVGGYEFGVITWLPMGASREYEEKCRAEKATWIKKYLPFATEINICSYGIPKQNCVQKRCSEMILIDDNTEVCKVWDTNKMRKSINISETFTAIDALRSLK